MEDDPIGKRRRPRQARAQVTVDAILDATLILLQRLPAKQVTTNRIAERAGVSIGSLYQYFDSKDALFRALLDRRRRQRMAGLLTLVQATRGQPIADIIRAVLARLFQPARDAPEVERVLNREMHRLRDLDDMLDVEVLFAKALVGVFEDNRDHLRSHHDPLAAAWLTVHTVSSAAYAFVMSGHLGGSIDADTLLAETTDLVIRYLCVDPPA